MLANTFCIAVSWIALLGAGVLSLTNASQHPFVDRTANTADGPTANQYDQHKRGIGYLNGEGTLLYASNINENANHETEVLDDPTQEGTSDESLPQIPNDADSTQETVHASVDHRLHRDAQNKPVWYGRYGRTFDTDMKYNQRTDVARGGLREGVEADRSQKIQNSNFINIDPQSNVIVKAGAATGAKITELEDTPFPRHARETDNLQTTWSAREVNKMMQKPLQSSMFGREANDGKLQPLWNARFGREANDEKQQPLWSRRFRREANDEKQQPLWSARFGREANDGKQQPLWSARYGREANDGKQQPLWSARYGREANDGKQQPLWSARFGREANDRQQQPLWSARFGREMNDGQQQPLWSARFGREADRIVERPLGYAKLRRGTDGFHHAREDREAIMEENIGQKPHFVNGFADDSTGKQVVFKLRELKRLLTHKGKKRSKLISAETMGSRDIELQSQKPIEIKNRGHLFKWRRPTKEELQRIDDVVHEELKSKS